MGLSVRPGQEKADGNSSLLHTNVGSMTVTKYPDTVKLILLLTSRYSKKSNPQYWENQPVSSVKAASSQIPIKIKEINE